MNIIQKIAAESYNLPHMLDKLDVSGVEHEILTSTDRSMLLSDETLIQVPLRDETGQIANKICLIYDSDNFLNYFYII